MPNLPNQSADYSADNAFIDSTLNQSTHSYTSRELEIIMGLSHDLNAKMIAGHLNLSVYTVQEHIKNIKSKMDVHTSGGIVAQAFRDQIID
jgi:DNA-binding NarL/FixJ family response regulator